MTRDNAYNGSGAGDSAVLTSADAAVGGGRRWRLRAGLAAGTSLLAVASLAFAAGIAQATTFPGTNGKIAASGKLQPPHATAAANSELELFTMDATFVAALATPIDPTECRLTDNGLSEYNPRFSQSGNMIAFVREGTVWTMKLQHDTATDKLCAIPNSERQLTAAAELDTFVGGWCTDSTDKQWVVYARNTVALSFEVYIIQVDPVTGLPAGAERALTLHTANDSQPAVTPDCSKIAFHSNRPSTDPANSDVWVASLDPNNPTAPMGMPVNRTDCSQAQESAPSWSPDGSKIVFQTNRLALNNLEIYRMNDPAGDDCSGSATSGATRLSYKGPSPAAGETGFDVTGYDLNPVYSPDGTKICFHSGRAPEFRTTGGAGVLGQWEIYTMNSSTGEATTTTAAERKTYRAGNDERCGWQAL